jgi:hypothetical protein
VKTRKVIIEVFGGVASILNKPKGVEVEIWDFDCDGTDPGEHHIAENGKPYVRDCYPAKHTITMC